MSRLIECVPNFSEGRDSAVIDAITATIEASEGVNLLDVDPGFATHRTVVTFVGEPEPVLNAAVAAAKKALELIDMSQHQGEHPRFGAMDVCPLVPVAGITMEETVEYARTLARRLGEEAGMTIYCYEEAALCPERRNLAHVRAGEYEGLAARLATPEGTPDFGPSDFNPRAGATAVSARDFLIAYNVNLNTTSTRRANALAFDVREKGRMRREPDPLTGEIVRDADGNPEWIPGSLKSVKGIGWFIEEYGIAQVSMNLTNTRVTPLHAAFDECVDKARARGMRVTGSEAVGLIPLQAMLDAGRHYLRLQQRSTGVPDAELIKIAVRSMGLDELSPFDPRAKIIEYAIEDAGANPLVHASLAGFTEQTASEAPAPGGGSVAAAVGAMGAALGTMVANLSSHKRGWDERWEEFSAVAERGKAAYVELLALVDKDTEAFNGIMAAWKAAPEERDAAIQSATRIAIEVPLRVMEVSVDCMQVCADMAESGMEASLSDAGVGALCARTAALGAYLNVRINASDLKDEDERKAYLDRAGDLRSTLEARESEVLAMVEAKLG
ncbi:MAG TPA: glutamate formimidoyltransferase [Planctomycetes bacterium]|nr:glutamate formimidoyltransferase [Planctomycetota bacterium]HIK61324.1 glutamate formimidoyltransferase [Planctomycetota bacterium]